MANKVVQADDVSIPIKSVSLSSLGIEVDPGIRELGISVPVGSTIFWAIGVVAVINKLPITGGLLSLPVNAEVAKQITFISDTTPVDNVSIIQVKQ